MLSHYYWLDYVVLCDYALESEDEELNKWNLDDDRIRLEESISEKEKEDKNSVDKEDKDGDDVNEENPDDDNDDDGGEPIDSMAPSLPASKLQYGNNDDWYLMYCMIQTTV